MRAYPGTIRTRRASGAMVASASLCAILSAMAISVNVLLAENPPPKKTAQQAFKNVRVLKNIPADDLIPTMEFVASALGVECDYCHDRKAFEKDDKLPKQTARRMMEMVLSLNGQSFQGERAVTCYSCHRGAIKPVAIPMVQSTEPYVSEYELPGDRSFPVQDNLPPASTILAKYISALGGEQALRRISTRIEKGTVSFGSGPPATVEVSSKAPDKQLTIVHLAQGDNAVAFDGQRGWLKSPGSQVREMHAADIEGARFDADLQLPLHLTQIFSDFKVIQQEQIGDHKAVLVFASHGGAPPVELYFDQGTGLLVRQTRFRKTQLGLDPTQIDYENYAEFDGVMVPLHVTIHRPGRYVEMRFVEVRQNSSISDSMFGNDRLEQETSHGSTPAKVRP
jgi:photosynthetic reaction center cytochrome c subunit